MNSAQEDISQLVEKTYRTTLDEVGWDEVVGDLARLTDAPQYLIYTSPPGPGVAPLDTVLVRRGFSDQALVDYFGHYIFCNVWAANRSVMVPDTAITSSMLYPDRLLKRTEYYDGWLRKVDVFHALGSAISDPGGTTYRMTLTRPEHHQAFGQRETRILNGVLPHVRSALATRRRMQRAEALVDAFTGAVAVLDQGVAILDANGRLVHANPLALEFIGDGCGLRLRDGRLECEHRATQSRLEAYLAHRGGRGSFTLRIPGRQDEGAQGLLVPLPREAGRRLQYVLVLRGARSVLPGAEESLRDGYGLSAAEAALAVALAQGKTLQEFADSRSVTLHTVRAQLKSASAKMAVRKQSELVAAVLRMPRTYEA